MRAGAAGAGLAGARPLRGVASPGGSDLDPVLFCIFETYLEGVDLVMGFFFFFSQMAEVLPGLFSGYGTECIVTGV